MEKAFYNYLLTNTRTTQCGIYNFSVTLTSVELGCSEEDVKNLLDKFVTYGKILYDEEHEEIMLLNWYKYNLNISRNTPICVNRELQVVKNKEFVGRFYELCKMKRYPLDIIFSGIDVGDTIKANEIKEEVKEDVKATFGDVVMHFNENIHLATSLELQNIREWCEKLNEDIVIMAINEAVKIYLEDWKKRGRKRQTEPKYIQNADSYRII